MRKLLATLSVLFAVGFVFAAPASAQDPVIGSITADPPIVPEAGTYDITANGTDFIPNSDILLSKCVAPGDALVFGEASTEDITAALGAAAADILGNCDVANAVPVTTDDNGAFSATFEGAEVGDNFIIAAGTLDGSQQGGTWVPIGDPAAAELAVTGVDSWTITLFGIGLLALGAGALYGSRRFELA